MSDASTSMGDGTPAASGPVVVVALKWADLFFDVDPLTGEASADPKARGFSAADEAALELALVLGGALGRPVVAISVGGAEAASGLERALSVGADRGVLVSLRDLEPQSLTVAAALAWGLEAAELVDPVVVCGDYSADRGSGAVPAGLAALTGLPQALGLVEVDVAPTEASDEPSRGEASPRSARIRVQRRLDGARREELLVSPPAVLSVEGAVARLRRAPLSGKLSDAAAKVERLSAPEAIEHAQPSPGVGEVGPSAPRTKVLAAPSGDGALGRVEALTGMSASASASPAQALAASPEQSARHLLEAWVDSGGTVPDGFSLDDLTPGSPTLVSATTDSPVPDTPTPSNPAPGEHPVAGPGGEPSSEADSSPGSSSPGRNA